MKYATTVHEVDFTTRIVDDLAALHVPHATSVLVDPKDGRLVGYTMCTMRGPKHLPVSCKCGASQ